jgi:hypothetical protein
MPSEQDALLLPAALGGTTVIPKAMSFGSVLIIVAAASGAFHSVQWIAAGALPNSGLYFEQYRVRIVLGEAEEWTGAELSGWLNGGAWFYQHEWFDFNPPNPVLFNIPGFEDLEYTSFYTSPGEWPNTTYHGNVVTVLSEVATPQQIGATWCDDVTVYGPGEFVIAQITLVCDGFCDPWNVEIFVSSSVDPLASVTDTFYGESGWGVGWGGVSPDAIDFGRWEIGTSSLPAGGYAPEWIGPFGWWDVSEANVAGPAAADFAATLDRMDFTVTFMPTTHGLREATLSLEGWAEWDEGDPNTVWTWWEVQTVALVGYGYCLGDLDEDADIDLADLAALLANYGGENVSYEDGDLDQDADVDLEDLAALLAVNGTECP